jgi:thiol:disulfide interchange protein DsbA
MNLRRQLSALLFLLPVAALALPYAPTADNDSAFLPGRDYTILQVPVPVSTGDKLEVREFFYYACGHCYNLEGSVNAWLKKKQPDTVFVRTPAVLNPRWELLGRAFYVAEDLKMLEQVHGAIYTSIHVGGQKLESKEKIIDLFVRLGADKAKAEAAWDSFAVTTKIRSADALGRKYMIQGTPTLTVSGKYVVPAGDRAFATIDYLLGLERAARARK